MVVPDGSDLYFTPQDSAVEGLPGGRESRGRPTSGPTAAGSITAAGG